MEDVTFEEHDAEKDKKPVIKMDLKPSTLGNIVVRYGIARTQRQANYILIGIALLFFLLSFVIVTYRETMNIGFGVSQSQQKMYGE